MRVLWATEGSANSTRAGGAIVNLRDGTEAEVITLAVIPGDPMPWLDLAEEQTAQQQLERMRREALHAVLDEALLRHGLAHGRATIVVEVGDPARTIARVAGEQQSDLIVAAPRHTAIATEIIGPTTLELMITAPCPVLVAREPDPWRIALLATDGSTESLPAERALAQFAPSRTRIMTLTVIPRSPSNAPAPSQEMEHEATGIAAASAQRLREGGADADFMVRTGRPATVIEEVAREIGADVIALGTHGHTGWRRTMLGSVAQEVSRTTRSSVLVAPPRPE